MKFDVTITIALKEGMLDPEASAIRNAITNLGYPTESLRTARLFRKYTGFHGRKKKF
jgi:phosphoribosylformylglycinamidine (FGAM) synthase PurS component